MRHPFEHLSPAAKRAQAWFWIALTLVGGAVMVRLDVSLRTPLSPHGVVSFELAFSDAAARAMVAAWDPTAQLIAAIGLGFDYLFLVCYSTAIGAASVALADGVPRLARLAGPVAWTAWLAACLDAVENASLAQVLLGDPATYWALIAGTCASIKFGLVGITLSFILVALGRRLLGFHRD